MEGEVTEVVGHRCGDDDSGHSPIQAPKNPIRSHIEQRWGTTFINVGGLSKYMGAGENCVPRSWLLTFTDSSEDVTAQCYLHTRDYVPQGWYPRFDRVIKLSKQLKMPSV
jgi:hypothetical protein